MEIYSPVQFLHQTYIGKPAKDANISHDLDSSIYLPTIIVATM